MKIENAVVLVTGANRGLGRAFTRALLAAGAKKVYGAARDPRELVEGVVPLKLDVTKPEQIAEAVRNAPDVTLIINNAGVTRDGSVLGDDIFEATRDLMETNAFGPLRLAQAFAPVLAKNGGGGIINVLSALSWAVLSRSAAYSASKAAGWQLTNALRNELRKQKTQVVAVHVGFIDTDMVRAIPVPKASPDDVARAALAGLEAGADEVLADDTARGVKKSLSSERDAQYLKPPII